MSIQFPKCLFYNSMLLQSKELRKGWTLAKGDKSARSRSFDPSWHCHAHNLGYSMQCTYKYTVYLSFCNGYPEVHHIRIKQYHCKYHHLWAETIKHRRSGLPFWSLKRYRQPVQCCNSKSTDTWNFGCIVPGRQHTMWRRHAVETGQRHLVVPGRQKNSAGHSLGVRGLVAELKTWQNKHSEALFVQIQGTIQKITMRRLQRLLQRIWEIACTSQNGKLGPNSTFKILPDKNWG